MASDLLSAETLTAAGSRSGRSWLGRLARSTAFSWLISLMVHAAVFLVLYKVAYRQEPAPRRLIIPEAKLAPMGGPAAPAPSGPMKLTQQAGPSQTELAAVSEELPSLITDAPAEIPDIIVPAKQSAAVASAGPVAAVSGVSAASPSMGGPVSSFFGQAGNAYKIVYVVDVSASLMIYMNDVVDEMQKSIRELLPIQRFHIVLAKAGGVQEFESARLVPAISKYKVSATAFVDSIRGFPDVGKADPIEAMKRAFAASPELIYFLSDGDYPDIQDQLETTLKQLNARRHVKITVIGFDPSPKPRALLERIARDHGGHFRWVEPK